MKTILLLSTLVCCSAWAQEELSAPPMPGPTPPPVALDTTTMPQEPQHDEGGRVRWGISGNLGWHLPPSAFTLGLEGRIGYQASNVFSAYAIAGMTAGFGIGINTVPGVDTQGANINLTALIYYYGGALAELMFGDTFFIAGGPVIASGAFTTGSAYASSDGVGEVRNITAIGLKPGIDVRLGFGFGNARRPSFRRGGFNISLDALILFHPDAIVSTARADGPNNSWNAGVSYGATIVTVTPMLMLGYDSR